MGNRFLLILLSTALLSVVSCQGQKAATVTSQEAAIDSYISRSHSSREVFRTEGSNRVVIQKGEGERVEVGDTVTVALKGYIFTSSPGTQFLEDTVTCKIGSGYLISGLDCGLRGALKGENSYIIFSAKYGFYDKRVGIVPAMSALLYDTTVLSIEKSE